jgi:hypothetical protein
VIFPRPALFVVFFALDVVVRVNGGLCSCCSLLPLCCLGFCLGGLVL